MAYQLFELGSLPTNIHAGDPLDIFWTGDGLPVNLTLCLSGDYGHIEVAVIDEDITGNTYTWIPSGSLSNGDYALELRQPPEGILFSHDLFLTGGQSNNTSSESKVSTSGTTFISSTEPTTPISSTQSSAAGLTSSSSILASGYGTSLGPTTPSVTLPGTTTTPPATTTNSPDTQNLAALQPTISNGTIAGIVVGVVIFVFLTMTSAMLYWRRRRRSSQKVVSELPSHQTDVEIKSDPSALIWIPELDREGAVSGPYELPCTPTPLAEPLGSLGATELSEGRVFEIANPDEIVT